MKYNQLKIGIALSYLSMGLNMVIQLAYTPIMIRLLGQSEYGLYTLVGSVVSYLGLFSFGFTGAYLRFYSRYKKDNDVEGVARLNGMFLALYIGMALLAAACGLALSQYTGQLFGSKLTVQELEKAKVLMQILAVNIALTFPSALFDSIVSAHEQFLFQRLLNIAGILFNPLLALPLLLSGKGSVAVVAVTTLVTIVKLFANAVFCIQKLKTPFRYNGIDLALLKEIAGFSFFLFLNMIIDQINWSIDKFILGRVAGTGAVAVYGVGAQINSLYTSFSTAISSVFAPQINRIAASDSDIDVKRKYTELFIKVGRVQFLVLSLIASGFIIFGQYFISNIYATQEYGLAYPVALWLILPVTIPLIQNLGIEIQRALNKHQARSIIYFLMAIANVAISIPLAKNYGPVGSALGTAISILCANGLIMNVYYHKAIGIDILKFWRSIAKMAKGLLPCAVAGFLIMKYVHFTGVLGFVFWILIYCCIYGVSFWMLGMNETEKQMIRKMAKK